MPCWNYRLGCSNKKLQPGVPCIIQFGIHHLSYCLLLPDDNRHLPGSRYTGIANVAVQHHEVGHMDRHNNGFYLGSLQLVNRSAKTVFEGTQLFLIIEDHKTVVRNSHKGIR